MKIQHSKCDIMYCAFVLPREVLYLMFVSLTHMLFHCLHVLVELISQDGCRRMHIELNCKQTSGSFIEVVDDNLPEH